MFFNRCKSHIEKNINIRYIAINYSIRYMTTLLILCRNYSVCHEMYYMHFLHQQDMFSIFQITIHLHKQLAPIHSQTFLQFIPASSALLFKLSYWVCVCVCMCVCACMCVCVRFLMGFDCVLFFVFQFGETARKIVHHCYCPCIPI